MDVVSPTAATIYAPTEDDELPIPAAKTEIRDVQRVETQNVSAPTSIASSTAGPERSFLMMSFTTFVHVQIRYRRRLLTSHARQWSRRTAL